MKKTFILQAIILVLLIILIVMRNLDYILWIQGYTNLSIIMLVWLLFLMIIVFEVLYIFIRKRNLQWLLVVVVMIIIISKFILIEQTSSTYRTYYDENNHEILVVSEKRILFGNIKFYSKVNPFFAKEFTSCVENLTVNCNYHIEEDNLIIEISGDGEQREEIILIPSE